MQGLAQPVLHLPDLVRRRHIVSPGSCGKLRHLYANVKVFEAFGPFADWLWPFRPYVSAKADLGRSGFPSISCWSASFTCPWASSSTPFRGPRDRFYPRFRTAVSI